MDFEVKINELQAKIAVEVKFKDGARNMLDQLTDLYTIEQCKQTMTEAEQRLALLLSEMKKVFLYNRSCSFDGSWILGSP